MTSNLEIICAHSGPACAFRSSSLDGSEVLRIRLSPNGKPALQNHGWDHKLAEIFDVSVDELLSGGKKMNVSEQRSKKLREDFHSSLEHALTEKYGPHPSLECVGRMQSEEMQDLLPENFIHNLNWLSRLFAEGHEKNFDVLVRGDLGSWFSAWLLGCSAVNPLPPHYYCPYCHKVEFVYDAYDGWDLPEKECCGHPMKQDGHRIPFEGSFLSARRSQDIEFDIAKRYLPNALGIISDYYRGIRQIVPTIFEDRQQPGVEVTDFYYSMVLFPPHWETPPLSEDGVTDFMNCHATAFTGCH